MPPVLRRPLGLILAGGGAHGAWQAACLGRLAAAHGLEFDRVLGFSAGALNGAAYCLDRLDLLIELWRSAESMRPLRLAPRLGPLSLFSAEPLAGALRRAGLDDATCRRALRRRLTVVALRLDDRRPRYSEFAPGGDPWDGPIEERLTASCSIPVVFPPVRIREGGRESVFVDGGIPGDEPVSFAALAGCRDVIVLEMTRADELGRPVSWLNPVDRLDQRAREGVRRLIDRGLQALERAAAPGAGVFRVQPSRRLGFHMLDFRSRSLLPALELGASDADSFMG